MTVHDHRVGFFVDDHQLAAAAGRYVNMGLAQGDPVLVVATGPHLALIEEAAFPDDRDPGAASGYVALDADPTLRSLTADGGPDRDRLLTTLGGLSEALGARRGRVRVLGEMVAMLWQRGDVATAIALEELWNDVAQDLDLELLCVYPAEALGRGDLPQLRRVCREHSAFVTPEVSSATAGATGSRVFLPAPQAVSAARRFVAEMLEEWGQTRVLDDVILIVSELATNAVLHGGSPFRASVRREGDSVLIEVEDANAGYPYREPRRLEGLDGRGIAIVEDLSHRSGCRRLADSKVIWAELEAG
ncbi:MAG: MEDS domain-containing protein [Nocardioides sp.]|nr:MEDS domain-containing protein [Nocardioides sp.]